MRIGNILAALLLGASPVAAATVQINIQGFAFGSNNQPVTVQAGDTVRWANRDTVTHTVTSGANRTHDGKFDGTVQAGASFSWTFPEAGTYPYYCRPHGPMVSSIIVQAAAPPSRAFGGASDNAVAAARHNADRIAAFASGTTLYLVDPTAPDLRDRANWAGGKELGATVTGRPSFGGSAGQLLVAVGTSAGRAMLFDALSGATLADVTVPNASLPEAPAIVPRGAAMDIYWAAQTAGGPTLVRTRGSEVVSTTSLGSNPVTVRSSPAVFGGSLVVGTSADVRTFRVDPDTGVLTPQGSASAPQGDFNTSPVITRFGQALIGAADGTVAKVNLATGAADGAVLALPAAAAPLSSPFYRAASDEAFFGGANGAIYRVAANALGLNASLAGSIPFGSGRVSTPAVAGTSVYAVDAGGKFGVAGNASFTQLGAAPGKAVSLTGVAPGADVALINTATGTLWAVPLS